MYSVKAIFSTTEYTPDMYRQYALAWIYWHNREWDKGRQHIEALPSISNNMLHETLLPYYINRDTEEGKKNWQAQIRDNY